MPIGFDPNRYGNPFASRTRVDNRSSESIESSVRDRRTYQAEGAEYFSKSGRSSAEGQSAHAHHKQTNKYQPSNQASVVRLSEALYYEGVATDVKSNLDIPPASSSVLALSSPNHKNCNSPGLGAPDGRNMPTAVKVNQVVDSSEVRKAQRYPRLPQSPQPSKSDPKHQAESLELPPTARKPAANVQEMLLKARNEKLRSIAIRNRLREQEKTTPLNDSALVQARDYARSNPSLSLLRDDESVNYSRKPCEEWISSPSEALEDPQDIRCRDNLNVATISYSKNGISKMSASVGTAKSNLLPQIVSGEHDIFVQIKQVDSKLSPVQDRLGLQNAQWATGAGLDSAKAHIDGCDNEFAKYFASDAIRVSSDLQTSLHKERDCQNFVEAQLAGFDGNWQPPPIDWDDRPRFDNKNREFQNAFYCWIQGVAEIAHDPSREINLKPLSRDAILNLNLHPDGLSMVERSLMIDKSNADKYGYTDAADATKYVLPMSSDEFEDWGKLDNSRSENQAHMEESAELLILNWRHKMAKQRAISKARSATTTKLREPKRSYVYEPNRNEPDIDIYLRPAIQSDVPQMTEIYNQHIQFGCRPAELNPISNADMQDRLSFAHSSKLPFLVAVPQNKKGILWPDTGPNLVSGQACTRNHKEIALKDDTSNGVEKIMGWACAQDFTAADYVERISVELEIYVKPEFRLRGIGRCLMDQMLVSLDCGYIKKGGYMFACAQDFRHIYSSGGGRDINKIMIIVRKYNHPIVPDNLPQSQQTSPGDREDDFDNWLKTWLKKFGFQLEAVLSGLGAKHGRFLDLAYMGKETAWKPAEGYIPDPLPDTLACKNVN